MPVEPADKTFTEAQIIEAVLDMIRRQSFANFYHEIWRNGGSFADSDTRNKIKSLLRVPLRVVAK